PRPLGGGSGRRGSPVHSRTSAMCDSWEWRGWAGYLAASSYSLVPEMEYYAIRHSAGLLDVSPLYKYLITGKDALHLVNKVVTRDASKLAKGQIYYTPWCDERGKTVDDGTLWNFGDGSFRMTSAGPRRCGTPSWRRAGDTTSHPRGCSHSTSLGSKRGSFWRRSSICPRGKQSSTRKCIRRWSSAWTGPSRGAKVRSSGGRRSSRNSDAVRHGERSAWKLTGKRWSVSTGTWGFPPSRPPSLGARRCHCTRATA